MPFISEELWHELKDRKEKECIIVEAWPKAKPSDAAIVKNGAVAFDVVAQVRNTRSSKGLSPKEALKLIAKPESKEALQQFLPVIQKLSNLSELSFSNEKVANATSFLVGTL
jgi:valyl-tRNA synthetase